MNINSNIFIPINNKLGEASETLDKLKEFLGKTQSVLETVGKISSALKVTVDLLKALDLFGTQKSELDMLFDKIQGLFMALMDQVNAQSKHETQLFVADKKGDVDEVISIVTTYLTSKKNETDRSILLAENAKSVGAITDLMQLPFWQRTFNENALTSLKWGHAWCKPPIDVDNLVWDYRLTLPTLLSAISARILYLSALETDFLSKGAHDELNKYADYLQNVVYPTIYAGIVRTPAPMPELMYLVNQPIHGLSAVWAHDDFGKPCGAIDRYSGLALIQNFPFGQPSADTPAAIVDISKNQKEVNRVYGQQFYFMFAIRAERGFQHVYEKIGMRTLWNFIGHIKKITGESFSELPSEQGYSIRRVINSPIKKIYETIVLNEHLKPMQPEEPLNLNIKDASGVYSLVHMSKISNPELSIPVPIGGLKPSVSLRAMLAGN